MYLLKALKRIEEVSLRKQSGMQGRPAEYVSNANDNLSHLDLQRHHQFPGLFNFTEEFAPFVRPDRNETLAEVPKRDLYTPPKNRRMTGVQQLSCYHQAVFF